MGSGALWDPADLSAPHLSGKDALGCGEEVDLTEPSLASEFGITGQQPQQRGGEHRLAAALSPTRASNSPTARSNGTSVTAATTPSAAWKRTPRSWTDKTASASYWPRPAWTAVIHSLMGYDHVDDVTNIRLAPVQVRTAYDQARLPARVVRTVTVFEWCLGSGVISTACKEPRHCWRATSG
jgi:hypothetical protein